MSARSKSAQAPVKIGDMVKGAPLAKDGNISEFSIASNQMVQVGLRFPSVVRQRLGFHARIAPFIVYLKSNGRGNPYMTFHGPGRKQILAAKRKRQAPRLTVLCRRAGNFRENRVFSGETYTDYANPCTHAVFIENPRALLDVLLVNWGCNRL